MGHKSKHKNVAVAANLENVGENQKWKCCFFRKSFAKLTNFSHLNKIFRSWGQVDICILLNLFAPTIKLGNIGLAELDNMG